MSYPVVVIGVPYAPPPPPGGSFQRGTNTWTGWDGSRWDLGNTDGGVVFTDGGVTGLHMPPFEHLTSESPATSGARWRGVRTLSRPVDWNLLIWSDASSEEWRLRDSAFWRTMHPDKTGTWTHTTPAGTSRHLRLRYTGGEQAFPLDPHEAGWVLYQPQMAADEPHWFGDEIVRSWGSPELVDFFNETAGPGDDHLFFISAASNIENATLLNPGDVSAWPIWTLTGPLSAVSIEVNGGMLGLPDVELGQTLVVNTDPRVATATLNGADVAGLVNPWDPRPVPPGAEVPTQIVASGTGLVTVTLVPRYYRAW